MHRMLYVELRVGKPPALADIIDFRVLDVATGLAIEVKTGTGDRHHHIGGVNQITVPEDYAEGYIASVLAREVSPAAGKTAIKS